MEVKEDLAVAALSVLVASTEPGSLPSRRLVHAFLWAFTQTSYVQPVPVPPPGAVAELAELDQAAWKLIKASETGQMILAVDLEDLDGQGADEK